MQTPRKKFCLMLNFILNVINPPATATEDEKAFFTDLSHLIYPFFSKFAVLPP